MGKTSVSKTEDAGPNPAAYAIEMFIQKELLASNTEDRALYGQFKYIFSLHKIIKAVV